MKMAQFRVWGVACVVIYVFKKMAKKMQKKLFKKGFTLTEVLLVVVILSILASMALPNYNKTVERARARDATTNLMAIHAANRIFFTETGQYWPNGLPGNLVDINRDLRLSIVANGFTYVCG